MGIGRVIDIGANAQQPTYQLAEISAASDEERRRGIWISADRARKNWADARAAVRLLGIPFVLLIAGRDRAILRRHSDYAPSRAHELIGEVVGIS
jgi:hypothetical protein